MRDWVEEAGALRGRGESFAMVTVVAVAGSSPRKAGAKMLVTAAELFGSVGGGRLEEEVIARARRMLSDLRMPSAAVGVLPLAASLGQCCGGKVAFAIERVLPPAEIAVFGAGHIAQALADIFLLLPCRAAFYDSRAQWREKLATAENVRAVACDDLPAAARDLPPGARAVVMTHSHPLDLEICAQLLARGDIPFVGLIGSESKRTRFAAQLSRRGLSAERLHCPIGGKAQHPGEVAVQIAAALIKETANKKETVADSKNAAAVMRQLSAMTKEKE